MAIGDYTNVLQQFYIAYFGRPADPIGLNSAAQALNAAGAPATTNGLVNAYATNATVRTLVDNFGSSAESQALYGAVTTPDTITNFVTQIYLNVLDRQPDLAGLLYWSNEISSGRLIPSRVALTILDAATRTADAQTVANKLAVANNFTTNLDTVAEINAYSGNAAAGIARDMLSNVDSTTNVAAFQATVQNTIVTIVNGAAPGNAFTLTAGVDAAAANVFNSQPVFTPGGNDFVNSLQDEDRLTGVGTNPTLNVVLGSVNDAAEAVIAPVLNNIQTANVEVTGNTQGINFQDATGLNTLNVNRITQTNAAVTFSDLDKSTTTIGLQNATRDGNVTFNYREDNLVGSGATAETLNVNLGNLRLNNLTLSEGNDTLEDAGYFFETVNVNVGGTGSTNIDNFTISPNSEEQKLARQNGTAEVNQAVNFVVNRALEVNNLTATGAETMSIVANAAVMVAADEDNVLRFSNNGITTPELRSLTITGAANVTIDGLEGDLANTAARAGVNTGVVGLTVAAGAMTGNLRLGVEAAADGVLSTTYANRGDIDVSITSGSGNDEIITYTGLAGSIVTNAGADTVRVVSGAAYETALNALNTLLAAVPPASAADIQAARLAVAAAHASLEGVSTIDTGTGNDTVSALDLGVTATDPNVFNNGGFDDVRAAIITTGDGADSVSVRSLLSTQDWDNGVLTDSNVDDTFAFVGASILTGNDDDSVTVRQLAENTLVNTGAGNDAFNASLTNQGTVLVGDTLNAQERQLAAPATVDILGAVVELGEGNDTANFAETSSINNGNQNNVNTLVGNDAELRGGIGADVLNVTALDTVIVVSRTGTVDVNDVNTTITGIETANLTIANQIDAATAAAVIDANGANLAQNDNNEVGAIIAVDVARFDNALTAINLVSQESVLLQNPANEVFEAGTETNFDVSNLRSNVALSLRANEATGVVGGVVGALQDDTMLSINAVTGVRTSSAAASDVNLGVDMIATGASDTFTLNINAASEAFDLTLGLFRTNTADNAGTTTGTTANMVENVVLNFADSNSHSIDATGFGDVQFRPDAAPVVAGDVSSPVATAFTVNSAAGAGSRIDVDNLTADTIRFNNAAGSAPTAANVTLRVTASNNYDIVTGSGTDIIDMRADDVRSDDLDTAVNRADIINTGAGRDTLIVSGTDDLGINNNLPGAASTIVDDDVFERISNLETVLSDTNVAAGNQRITLDEAAQVTGVDTIRLVGDRVDNAAHTLNLVVGNNFSVAAGAANGELADNTNTALVIDASLHRDQTTLNLESKDDDADQDRVDMDIRLAAKAGATFNLFNSGSEDSQVELRVFTADENDAHVVSSANAGNADGLVDVNVTNGSFDKLVFVEGTTANDNSGGGALGTEAAMTVTIDANWTRANGSFAVDASQVLDTDESLATGGATITAAAGDTATLNISGTQNNDVITGGDRNDTIAGNAGNDAILSGAGADLVTGGTGNDTINGQSGNDSIDGGEGADLITGGLGADSLTGGAGNDTFVVNAVLESIQSTADTISDFATGADRISIENMTATNGSVINLGRFATVASSGDGDNSLDGTVGVPKKFDAYYSSSGQLAIDVDGDGDITDINDIVINSANAINAGDINYQINIAGGNNTVRLGQGVDRITTGNGNDTFVVIGSLSAAEAAQYVAAGPGIVDASVAPVVVYNDLLNARAGSEINAGDIIDGGAGGGDELHTYGTTNFVGATLNEVEFLVIHSNVTLTLAQVYSLQQIIFSGNTPHSLTIVGNNGEVLSLNDQLSALAGMPGQVGEEMGSTAITVGGTVYANAAALNAAVGAAPVVAPPNAPNDLRNSDDSGVNNTDNITNNSDVDTINQVSGGAPAGTNVTVFIDTDNDNVMDAGEARVTVAANPFNTYTVDLPESGFVEGVNFVKAFTTNATGLRSDVTAGFAITVDTTAPVAPTNLDLVAGSDSNINNDNITNIQNVTITGESEPGATIQMFVAGVANGPAVVANGAGVFSATVSLTANQLNAITARATDAAGNLSPISGVLGVVHDNVAPAAPTIDLADASDTGISNTDNLTTSGNVTINGTAEAGSTVTITGGNGAPVVVAANGAGTYTAVVNLTANALNNLSVTARDTAGNQSGASVLGVTNDVNAPAAPAFTVNDNQGAIMGALANNAVTDDTTLTISGNVGVANDRGTVTVFANGIQIGAPVAVDVNTGNWTLTTPALPNGSVNSFTAQLTDRAGLTSVASLATTVTVDTVAPAINSIVFGMPTGALNNTLNAGDVARAVVTFNEDITVANLGTATLAMVIGGTTVQATAVSNTVDTVTFEYTIQAGQTDANGISIPANPITLNAATIRDAAGNNAVLTAAAVADSAQNLVDTTAPAATITAVDFTNVGANNNFGLLTITGTGFGVAANNDSLNLANLSFGAIALNGVLGVNGDNAVNSTIVTHTDTSIVIRFNDDGFVAAPGRFTDNGAEALVANAGAFVDAAGNASTAAATGSNNAALVAANVSAAVANSGQITDTTQTLTGQNRIDTLTGDNLNANSFRGNEGNDILTGAAAVADTFVFTAPSATNIDTINNFIAVNPPPAGVRDVLDFVNGGGLGVSLDGAGELNFLAAANLAVGGVSRVVAFTDNLQAGILTSLQDIANFLNSDADNNGGNGVQQRFTQVANALADDNNTVFLIRGVGGSTDVGVYLFRDSGTPNTTVEAAELTQLATIVGINGFDNVNFTQDNVIA